MSLGQERCDAADVIIMPMSRNNQPHLAQGIIIETFQVLDCDRIGPAPTKTGVDYAPVVITEVNENTLTSAWTENRNLEFVWFRRDDFHLHGTTFPNPTLSARQRLVSFESR